MSAWVIGRQLQEYHIFGDISMRPLGYHLSKHDMQHKDLIFWLEMAQDTWPGDENSIDKCSMQWPNAATLQFYKVHINLEDHMVTYCEKKKSRYRVGSEYAAFYENQN
jgi:hypothetical protein